MAKPSGTNYPRTFRENSYMSPANSQYRQFWWLWSGCSPLPIPNREVKPFIADDTALVCGKVGRRQSFTEGVSSGAPFFVFDWSDRFDRGDRFDRFDRYFYSICQRYCFRGTLPVFVISIPSAMRRVAWAGKCGARRPEDDTTRWQGSCPSGAPRMIRPTKRLWLG